MPRGRVRPTPRRVHPIVDPAPTGAVVKAIGVRKWMVTGWLVVTAVLLVLYLGVDAACAPLTTRPAPACVAARPPALARSCRPLTSAGAHGRVPRLAATP